MVGWDIGGVNTKVARVGPTRDAAREWRVPIAAAIRTYEIQRDPGGLAAVVSALCREVGASAGDVHAVTMTAELSQFFRTKREGVAFILDGIASAVPESRVHVYSTDGDFLSPRAAKARPLAVAAANWAATAQVVARVAPDAILIDIGSTTTDIIPIVAGTVTAVGRTDPDRLASGELLYLGVIRTPVEAITRTVPLGAGYAGVSAEAFALAGDAHLWRGALAPSAYVAPTPDGRPATRVFAGERLARVVCGDREMLDDDAIDRIAAAIAESQIARTADAVARVRARQHPAVTTAIVTGVGDFVAAAAAERAGLAVRWLAEELGTDAARGAPAAAVALLLSWAIAAADVGVTATRHALGTRPTAPRSGEDGRAAPNE